ncbi:MAG TPA: hypothetical protein VLL48_05960, partial [Longimicrobiales bacterium]|nr:hypothetical protein [Longimicrobiales bacterium]
VHVPASWDDTTLPERLIRVPLVLGVRNRGTEAARPETLSLSLPGRYRLTDRNGGLEVTAPSGSPLITYSLATGLDPVEPRRLPKLVPALDTLWLEVRVPAYYCIALADSVPELVPAAVPPPGTLGEVRIFYAFEGGDLTARSTGTLTVRLDTALLDLPAVAAPPTFPVVLDTAAADPRPVGLRLEGRRTIQCGEPHNPLELTTAVWVAPAGGRMIALEYGGRVRKRLYDLNGDGIIERESWDSDGDGVFEATRQARLPTPAFLLLGDSPGGAQAPAVAPDR